MVNSNVLGTAYEMGTPVFERSRELASNTGQSCSINSITGVRRKRKKKLEKTSNLGVRARSTNATYTHTNTMHTK